MAGHEAHGSTPANPEERPHTVCPWWIGYLLISPLRRWAERPDRLLAPLVPAGATVIDIGCAMGFYSIPLARLVGANGRVVCVDLQERMLATLRRRARRRGLDAVIETRPCPADSLPLDDLAGTADVALAIHVVHEVPDPAVFFATCRRVLRPGGQLLFAEPRGHVSAAEFTASLGHARDAGFACSDNPPAIRRSRTALLA